MHYHFVDDAEFDRLVAAGELLEWAEFAGNRYGTPRRPGPRAARGRGSRRCWRSSCRAPGRSGRAMPEAQLVFLAPPSWEELVSRLAGRGTEPPSVQERRLAIAQAELDAEGSSTWSSSTTTSPARPTSW